MNLRSIVSPTMTRREARAALHAAGWTFAGGGSFASVWASPDGTRVAKVNKPDAGAEATYEVATAHPDNPFLPTYFDRIPLANGGAVFEVEKLNPFYGYEDWEEAQTDAEGDPSYEEALSYLAERETGDGFSDDGVSWDDHWRNAMRRPDGTIVLTDYLADMGELRNATVSGDDAEHGDYTDSSRRGSNHYPQVEFKEPTDVAL